MKFTPIYTLSYFAYKLDNASDLPNMKQNKGDGYSVTTKQYEKATIINSNYYIFKCGSYCYCYLCMKHKTESKPIYLNNTYAL